MDRSGAKWNVREGSGFHMLLGQYEHTLDVKGRMNVPSKFRDALGETFVITKGTDTCLSVYSMKEWEVLAERVSKLPESKAQTLRRFFFANAVEVELDKQNRIVIPAVLRKYANLEKEVMVVGVMNKAEIWERDAWNETMSDISPETMEEALAALDDL